MIVLFSDFGLEGPYTGQVKTVLHRAAPEVPVIDLFADLPAGKPQPAAYLLAAYAAWFPPGTVLLAVVDPGVGGARAAIIVEADGRWYVGPDNGLFELVHAPRRAAPGAGRYRRAAGGDFGKLSRPRSVRAGGRAAGPRRDACRPAPRRRHRTPSGLAGRPAGIVYIDRYGNAMTGLRAALLRKGRGWLPSRASVCARARTFSDVPAGEAFWYENSNGLAEIAVNAGRADAALGLAIGAPVAILR